MDTCVAPVERWQQESQGVRRVQPSVSSALLGLWRWPRNQGPENPVKLSMTTSQQLSHTHADRVMPAVHNLSRGASSPTDDMEGAYQAMARCSQGCSEGSPGSVALTSGQQHRAQQGAVQLFPPRLNAAPHACSELELPKAAHGCPGARPVPASRSGHSLSRCSVLPQKRYDFPTQCTKGMPV